VTPQRTRRSPQSVYGIGAEPDPRFSFANERTFLAWVCTSLALIAAGVSLDGFVTDFPAAALGYGVALTALLVTVMLLTHR
jgi:putative membrane protein